MAKKSKFGVNTYDPKPASKRRRKPRPYNVTKRLNKRSPFARMKKKKRGQG